MISKKKVGYMMKSVSRMFTVFLRGEFNSPRKSVQQHPLQRHPLLLIMSDRALRFFLLSSSLTGVDSKYLKYSEGVDIWNYPPPHFGGRRSSPI